MCFRVSFSPWYRHNWLVPVPPRYYIAACMQVPPFVSSPENQSALHHFITFPLCDWEREIVMWKHALQYWNGLVESVVASNTPRFWAFPNCFPCDISIIVTFAPPPPFFSLWLSCCSSLKERALYFREVICPKDLPFHLLVLLLLKQQPGIGEASSSSAGAASVWLPLDLMPYFFFCCCCYCNCCRIVHASQD